MFMIFPVCNVQIIAIINKYLHTVNVIIIGLMVFVVRSGSCMDVSEFGVSVCLS